MAKKKRLKPEQEFEIMKLVLDKFLWLGFIVMGWSIYLSLTQEVLAGIWHLIAGAVLLLLFLLIIIKEYEIIT